MKFCRHCGKEVLDEAIICPGCGCSIQVSNNVNVDNSISIGLVIVSILIPLFGIIYWPINAKTRPKCAEACGIAALISWAVYIFFWVSISMNLF